MPRLSRFYGPHDWKQMTRSEIAAYAEEMEPLRAEGMLDAAQVAIYPSTMQFAPDTAQAWWRGLAEAAAGAAMATADVARSVTGFVFNNVAVTFDQLKAKAASMLGGGLAE
jgi:hypothetical protein